MPMTWKGIKELFSGHVMVTDRCTCRPFIDKNECEHRYFLDWLRGDLQLDAFAPNKRGRHVELPSASAWMTLEQIEASVESKAKKRKMIRESALGLLQSI